MTLGRASYFGNEIVFIFGWNLVISHPKRRRNHEGSWIKPSDREGNIFDAKFPDQ
jgi:hypothetical protein